MHALSRMRLVTHSLITSFILVIFLCMIFILRCSRKVHRLKVAAFSRRVPAIQRPFIDNVRDLFDVRDVYHDVVAFTESQKEKVMRKYTEASLDVEYEYKPLVILLRTVKTIASASHLFHS